ncbi:hypothetical protein PTSG_05258 [Salpingoeca rosetta]|uniref:TFA2 Winged helix domain-containing protein n=1 Tax=Salpingoeca rosetta (strain ATCC 50818 / BSB-021) TaxID=946362 RepID=F2U9X6_SALR5|nr:uncharacterized protein PTSG_05258 [Salpingoeca rosetta]EGD73551.1 hypothetical protein PTSG_05258 [Salpingoeca rosetta]|eukprot:XP_004993833.1 hypothetical protein PTSG_05258 [Salpingoeca rosetta]
MSFTSRRVRRLHVGEAIHRMQELLKRSPTALPFTDVLQQLELTEYPEQQIEKLKHEINERDSKLHLEDGYVAFQPTYDVKNKQELLDKLKEFDQKGLGGMRVDELDGSYDGVLLDVDELKAKDLVYCIHNKTDRVDVLFFKDPALRVHIDKAIVKRWRMESVQGKTDKELKQYLINAQMKPLQVEKIPKKPVAKDGKKKRRRRRDAKRSQRVLAGVHQFINAPKPVSSPPPSSSSAASASSAQAAKASK